MREQDRIQYGQIPCYSFLDNEDRPNTSSKFPTARDKKMLLALYIHRRLTSFDFEKLFFTDPYEMDDGENRASTKCPHRLKKLFELEYIDRRKHAEEDENGNVIDNPPYTYKLKTLGAKVVAQIYSDFLGYEVCLQDLNWKFDDYKVLSRMHLRDLNQTRIAIELGARINNYNIRLVDDMREKSQEEFVNIVHGNKKPKNKRIIPDWLFLLEANGRMFPFDVEEDRGTESHNVWAEKILGHIKHQRIQTFQNRYGFKSPKITLTVTNSKRRMKNLLETTAKVGGGEQFWFTWKEVVNQHTFFNEAIWVDAKNFRPRKLPVD